jgi:hypothetical protein
MDELQKIIDGMEPAAALTRMAAAVSSLFPQVDEEARLHFVVGLIGEAGADKVGSLVQL